MKQEILRYLSSWLLAVVILVGSLVVASLFIGANIALSYLVELGTGQDFIARRIVEVLLDITLVSLAFIVTVNGAVVVIAESFVSTANFVQRLRSGP